MARKTVRQQKDEASAQMVEDVNENVTEAKEAIAEANAADEPAKPEDGLYTYDGVQVMTPDDKPYTLAMLTELETTVSGQAKDENIGKVEELTKRAEALTADVQRVMSDRDMWKQRAQDAETRIARFKEGLPRDSMGMPKVVD